MRKTNCFLEKIEQDLDREVEFFPTAVANGLHAIMIRRKEQYWKH